MPSPQSTNTNNQSKHNGLYVLLGLIFNSVCWIILLLLSFFPWFCIYLCMFMTNNKVYVEDKNKSISLKESADSCNNYDSISKSDIKEENNIVSLNITDDIEDVKNSSDKEQDRNENNHQNKKVAKTKTPTHIYSKKTCTKFIQTYQFWTGFGTILNVTLIWLLFLLVYPHVIIKYGLEWQIAIYVFFATYGILIVFQGMM
eukprot:57609_1